MNVDFEYAPISPIVVSLRNNIQIISTQGTKSIEFKYPIIVNENGYNEVFFPVILTSNDNVDKNQTCN